MTNFYTCLFLACGVDCGSLSFSYIFLWGILYMSKYRVIYLLQPKPFQLAVHDGSGENAHHHHMRSYTREYDMSGSPITISNLLGVSA